MVASALALVAGLGFTVLGIHDCCCGASYLQRWAGNPALIFGPTLLLIGWVWGIVAVKAR